MTKDNSLTQGAIEVKLDGIASEAAARIMGNDHLRHLLDEQQQEEVHGDVQTAVRIALTTVNQLCDYALRGMAAREPEPRDYDRERVAHKAALDIRPEVSGDREYWRLRGIISSALDSFAPPLPVAGRDEPSVTEAMVAVRNAGYWHNDGLEEAAQIAERWLPTPSGMRQSEVAAAIAKVIREAKQ